MIIKQSTAYTFRLGPFLDETDGKTAETGLTISQADVRLSKAGGNFAQKNESSSSSHDEIGFYICALDTTDTNTCGELMVAVHESGALPVLKTFQVVEEHIYAALYAASAAAFDANQRVDVSQIEGSDATDQINAACDASIVTYNLDHLMKTAVASNTDMTTEVTDGSVLSNLMTKTGDTSDYAYATDSLEALGEDVDTILADTNELQADWADGGRLDTIVDSILTDTGTTLDGKINTIDGIVDSILVDTGTTLDGKLNSLWTTAITESYASDGAAATPAQLLYMVWCAVHEFSISSTTITGKKLDGSTTAMTWTINSASEPTSRTRAS